MSPMDMGHLRGFRLQYSFSLAGRSKITQRIKTLARKRTLEERLGTILKTARNSPRKQIARTSVFNRPSTTGDYGCDDWSKSKGFFRPAIPLASPFWCWLNVEKLQADTQSPCHPLLSFNSQLWELPSVITLACCPPRRSCRTTGPLD
jgi:hypothetical protein